MRWLGLTLGIVVLAAAVKAQTPLAFGNFKCVCQPGSPLQMPTVSPLGAPSVGLWRGTVFALSDIDARMKAKNACNAESRTTASLCDTCQCFR